MTLKRYDQSLESLRVGLTQEKIPCPTNLARYVVAVVAVASDAMKQRQALQYRAVCAAAQSQIGDDAYAQFIDFLSRRKILREFAFFPPELENFALLAIKRRNKVFAENLKSDFDSGIPPKPVSQKSFAMPDPDIQRSEPTESQSLQIENKILRGQVQVYQVLLESVCVYLNIPSDPPEFSSLKQRLISRS